MAESMPREERFTRETPVASRGVPAHESGKGWYWVLVVPFFGTFFPWIYNTRAPELFGIPFFYWYQMAWVPISVIITVAVYRATRGRSS